MKRVDRLNEIISIIHYDSLLTNLLPSFPTFTTTTFLTDAFLAESLDFNLRIPSNSHRHLRSPPGCHRSIAICHLHIRCMTHQRVSNHHLLYDRQYHDLPPSY